MSAKSINPSAASLSPIRGMCYAPTPSDDTAPPLQKYFDSDFTNSSFPQLWGGGASGRNDLAALRALNVNFLHLYNWSVPPAPGAEPGPYQRSHLEFLNAALAAGIKVFIPISNYFLQQIHDGNGSTVQGQIQAMVAEIYQTSGIYQGAEPQLDGAPHPAAAIWGIGNEFDLAAEFDVNDVVTAIGYLLEAEAIYANPSPLIRRLPITAPVSFAATPNHGPGIKAILNLQAAIAASPIAAVREIWDTRFVASTNPQNDGTFIAGYISTTFPEAFPDLRFFFTEVGTPIEPNTPVTDDKQQAAYVLSQLQNCTPAGNFLGACVFQFLDQSAVKAAPEDTFGMMKYATLPPTKFGLIQPADYVPGGGETYPIDKLAAKPMHASVKEAFGA